MNILQVIPYFTPKRGGDVNVCYNISKELSSNLHSVTIITTDLEFDEDYAKSLKGIEVIPFHVYARYGLFLITPNLNNWLQSHIINYDVIHMHSFQSYQNSIVYKYAMKYHVPYIIQAHGLVPSLMKKSILKRCYNFVWGNEMLIRAAKSIAITRTEIDEYLEMGLNSTDISLIPNGLNLNDYNDMPNKGEFRKIHKISNNEKIILYLGRLHKIKGIDFLIDSFKELSKSMDNVMLVIVGPDEGYRNILKNRIAKLNISKKVFFTGPLYGYDKYAAYIDADLYVLPSEFESFSITALEACMCGTPIVVMEKCGCGELVKSLNCGYCIKDKSISELAICIKDILCRPTEAKKRAKMGREYIITNLSWSNLVKQLENIYLDVIRDCK